MVMAASVLSGASVAPATFAVAGAAEGTTAVYAGEMYRSNTTEPPSVSTPNGQI